ncbi:MAG: hypothetical protein RQM92_06535 [Candidatus Syntrophopropionicum ammoniitolerans]
MATILAGHRVIAQAAAQMALPVAFIGLHEGLATGHGEYWCALAAPDNVYENPLAVKEDYIDID